MRRSDGKSQVWKAEFWGLRLWRLMVAQHELLICELL